MAEPVAAQARCERCGGAFHCGANDAQPCACTTLKLDAGTLARLRDAYRGCLCLRCLAEIAAGGAISASERSRAR
jgi:hypothetical protein